MSYQPPDPTYLSLALKYNDVNNFVKNSTQLQTLKNIARNWQTPQNIRPCSPVSMNMACTVGVAEVDQGRVDQNVLLALFQQVLKDFLLSFFSLIFRSRFLLLFSSFLPKVFFIILIFHLEVAQVSEAAAYSIPFRRSVEAR